MPDAEATRSPWGRAALAAGALLIAAAVFVSNATLEGALGRPAGALSWGATLFRFLLGLHGALLVVVGLRAGRRRDAAPSAPPRADPTPPRTWLWLAGICLVALILRLVHLGSGLWFDEVLTFLSWVRAPIGVTLTSLPDQNNHILFSILAQGSVAILGESAWAVRLPSALFGVGSVWSLFVLGRRVIGTREALLAAALLAVSYHHIWFSQNARGYSGSCSSRSSPPGCGLEALPRRSGAPLDGVRRLRGPGDVGAPHHGPSSWRAMAWSTWYWAAAVLPRGDGWWPVTWWPLLAFTLSVTLTLQLYALPSPASLARACTRCPGRRSG